jgi:hypothetical protein
MGKIIVTLAAALALAACGSAASTPKPSASATTSAAAAPVSSASSLCSQLVAWRDAHASAQLAAVESALSRWSTDAAAGKYATVTGRDSTALAKASAAALSNPPPGAGAGPYTAAMTYLSSGAADAKSAMGEPLSEEAGSITAAGGAFQDGIRQLAKATADLTSAGCG